MRRARSALRFTPLQRWRFSGRTPERLLVAPPELRLADPQIAIDIYHGRFLFAGRLVETAGASPFSLRTGSDDWLRALHGFRWLRHMREAGTDLAAANARALVGDWMAAHGRRLSGPAWEPAVAAHRQLAWLPPSAVLLQGAGLTFYRSYLRQLAMHVRFLRVAVREMEDGEELLRARIALALAALCMPTPTGAIRKASRNLGQELDRQILPDGGHISRNPGALAELLADLLPLRQTYASQAHQAPQALMGAIDRMMPALRFFRHVDGDLARFNGMGATIADRVTSVLRHDDTGGATLSHAPHSGYERLAMGGTTLLADTGMPPPLAVSGQAHAGCLSFEFSSGRNQYVVNAGVDAYGPDDYRPLARATAAHSTATIDDTSSARFHAPAALRGLLGSPLHDGPSNVTCQRADSPDAQRFVASHDGYLAQFGVIHEREMALSHDGSVIEGHDRFLRPGGAVRTAKGNEIAIRFHIHPDAELFQDSEDRLVIGGREGDYWTLSCEQVVPRVEDSIFFAALGGPRRSAQIVLAVGFGEHADVRGQFTRTRIGGRR